MKTSQTTEIILQTSENRIKVLEVDKDEIQKDIEYLETTLKTLNELKDKVRVTSSAYSEIKAFIKRINEQILINQGIRDEIQDSINFISQR